MFFLTENTEDSAKDIVFLLDETDNTRDDFPVIRDFVYKIIEKLVIGPKNARVAVVQFSNDAVANFFLNSFTKKEDILTSVRRLSHRGGRLRQLGSALKYVKENVFTPESGSRHTANIPQVLVVLSSGPSTDVVDVPVASLKQSNVTIITIGRKNFGHKEMEKIARAPRYSILVSEMADLPNIKEAVVAAIAEEKFNPEFSRPEVFGKHNHTLYVLLCDRIVIEYLVAKYKTTNYGNEMDYFEEYEKKSNRN